MAFRRLLAVPVVLALTMGAAPNAAYADTLCPSPTVSVATEGQLGAALSGAAPGDVIALADGTYDGNWTASTPGTETDPIWLCGGPGATLTNDGISGGYGLHLNAADWWQLYGFAITDAAKGLVIDASEHVTVEGLTVHGLGDEGIHLRSNTTDSLVVGNTIYSTGHRRDKFGEGVYIGSANGNWSVYTAGQPDRSDRNTVSGNVIFDVTAEPVDIKEGTSWGVVSGNTFDASSLTEDGGDSCIDAKGNDWLISGNVCTGAARDGFQTHRNKLIKLGLGDWGFRNEFTANTAVLAPGATGLGFRIHDAQYVAAVVRCGNTATGGVGFANVTCTP